MVPLVAIVTVEIWGRGSSLSSSWRVFVNESQRAARDTRGSPLREVGDGDEEDKMEALGSGIGRGREGERRWGRRCERRSRR